MAFIDILDTYNINKLSERIYSKTGKDAEKALSSSEVGEEDLCALLSPAALPYLEYMAQKAQAITLARFGKTIKIYAPLYVSNDCINSCVYCGFNRKTNIPRITLSDEEIEKESRILSERGIKNILIVSGDNKNAFSDERLRNTVKICAKYFPLVTIEVRSLPEEEYRRLYEAGADGFTMFQETYIKSLYPEFHPRGPKSDFAFRLDAPERAARAGIRNIGLGALLGLADFRIDVFFMCLHASYIAKKYWRSLVSASFPRIRSSAGCYSPRHPATDRDIVQIIAAFRLFLNDAGVNISTRESSDFRDRLIHLGATIMSAGSRTEPGGYSKSQEDAGQFRIEDGRSTEEFINAVKKAGYDPIMKDWDDNLRKIN